MSKQEKLNVIWSQAAWNDYEKILQYYGHHDLAYALQVESEISSLSQSLSRLPTRGRVVPELLTQAIEKYREIIHHPFRLIYFIEKNDVVLAGLFDSRRELEQLIFERAKSF